MALQIGGRKTLVTAGQWRQVEVRRLLVDEGRGQHVAVDAKPEVKPGRHQPKHDDRQHIEPTLHYSAGCAAAASCRSRRDGAPTRWRRSLSDTSPPNAITAAPSQIHGTSGL